MKINADTPTGIYKINGWEESADKAMYGPNKVLSLTPLSGEAKDAADNGRTGILHHGGRQEGPKGDPKNLGTTHGCTRVFDNDQKNLISITKDLEKNDPDEKPGTYTVEDALVYPTIIVTPKEKTETDNKEEQK